MDNFKWMLEYVNAATLNYLYLLMKLIVLTIAHNAAMVRFEEQE